MNIGSESVTPNGQTGDVPAWRKQFPIDTQAEVANSRRQFIGGLAVAGGAMACGQVALHIVTDEASTDHDEESNQEFAPLVLDKKLSDIRVGEAFTFHYPHEKSPCLFARTTDREFVAVTQKCTHLACPVIPDLENSTLHCPCHHGRFDLAGNPISGPPRKPLRKVRIEVSNDGTLTAVGFA